MLPRLSLAALLGLAAGAALADDHLTEVPFALDWRFEGPSAPYFLAVDNGYFEAAGLSVAVTAGQGSLDAIPRVASGAFPMGFADINSLIRFLDQNPGAPVIAVMMVYDAPPFAIVGRVSQGIEGIDDLEGSVLGAPPPDGAWAQFPDPGRVERHRRGRDHRRAGRLSDARADAGRRRGGRSDRFQLLVLLEPRQSGRPRGRHHHDPVRRSRCRPLRQRDHRQHRFRGGQPRRRHRVSSPRSRWAGPTPSPTRPPAPKP